MSLEPLVIDDERSEPVTDEDVARGELEPGWIPALRYPRDYLFTKPAADAPSGTLTFSTCSWPVRRMAGWVFATYPVVVYARLVKIRVPLDEDEELALKPCAVEDARVGEVLVCCERQRTFIVRVDRVSESGTWVRMLGSGDEPLPLVPGKSDIFVVCKQSTAPFVLK